MSKPVLSDLDFGTVARITGLPAAVSAGQPVIFEQLNSAIESIAWKDNVRVASVANINLAAPGATINGITMATNDRFLAKDQTSVPENGIYIYNGAATPATRSLDASTFDELESAVLTVDEGTSAGATFRQTSINGVIGTNNVVWTSFGTAAPSASESIAGIVELATQAEVDTGTDDLRAVTPLKLATWSGRIRKSAATIGDGAATSYNFDHNFNTRDVTVALMKNSGNYDEVLADITRPTVNRVTVVFASAPASNAYRVVVTG